MIVGFQGPIYFLWRKVPYNTYCTTWFRPDNSRKRSDKNNKLVLIIYFLDIPFYM